MSETDKQYLIEQFLAGELSETQREKFEASLAADPELREELKLTLQAKYAIKTTAEEELKKQFDDWFTQAQGQSRFLMRNRYYLIGAIVAGAALVAGILLFRPKPQPIKLDALYAQYMEMPAASMYREIGEDDLSASAFAYYTEDNYVQAQQAFSMLASDSSYSRKAMAHFFAGLSSVGLSQPDQALEHLNQISSSSAFYQQAMWYRIMAYLQKGDKDAAVRALDSLMLIIPPESELYKRGELLKNAMM